MSFEEIFDVVCTLEYRPDLEEVYQEQPYEPQMYQTHFPYELCPKGFDKYIVITRYDNALKP